MQSGFIELKYLILAVLSLPFPKPPISLLCDSSDVPFYNKLN